MLLKLEANIQAAEDESELVVETFDIVTDVCNFR